jgi:hypothetical protein
MGQDIHGDKLRGGGAEVGDGDGLGEFRIVGAGDGVGLASLGPWALAPLLLDDDESSRTYLLRLILEELGGNEVYQFTVGKGGVSSMS